MPAKQDKRTGHWFFRKMVTLPDGTKRRIFGVPTDYGEKDTKTGALEAERIAITRIRETATTDPKPPAPTAPAVKEVPTVEDFAPVWLAKSRADNKPASYKTQTRALNGHIVPEFGKLRLDQVDFDKVETWRVRLINDDELGPATVARLLSQFPPLLNYGRKKGLIVAVPEWPTQAAPLPRPTFLSFEQTDRLIAAAEPMDPWKAMVIVAVRTGLRHGELTGLRWEDVDLDGGKLSVVRNLVDGVFGTPKSGKGRELPLSNDAIRALRTLYRSRRGEVVFSSQTGKPLTHSWTDRALRLICRHAELSPIGWHKLRHTFASHLAIRGVSLSAIRELLGHANIKMTLRYAHLAPEVRREAVMLLDEPPPSKGKDKKSKKSKRIEPSDNDEE